MRRLLFGQERRGQVGLAFDQLRARELTRLIGKAYAVYFVQRFGENPAAWKPSTAKRNYAVYLPARPPDDWEHILTLYATIGNRGQHAMGLLLRRRGGAREFALVFRGTASDQEWLRDALLLQTKCEIDVGGEDTGRVHLGFWQIYRSLSPPPSRLIRVIPEHAALYIAGHSLGGALGAFAALELHRLRPIFYSFGAPRLGDPRFAACFARRTPHAFRVANFWDPVVRLPEETAELLIRRYEYRHVGRLLEVFSLSHRDGESLSHAAEAGHDWMSLLLERVRQRDPVDLLFLHQLRAYEHAMYKPLPAALYGEDRAATASASEA